MDALRSNGSLRRAAWIAVLLVWVAGCGARVAPAGVGEAPVVASSAPVPGADGGAATMEVPTGDVAPGAIEEQPAVAQSAPAPDAPMEPPEDDDDEAWWRPGPQPPPPGHNTVRVELSRSCAELGSVIEAIFNTGRPKAGLAMIVGYADGRSHGSQGFGTADDAGRYVWQFVVSPSAPPGQASVMVSASAPPDGSQTSGTGSAPLTVATPGGC